MAPVSRVPGPRQFPLRPYTRRRLIASIRQSRTTALGAIHTVLGCPGTAPEDVDGAVRAPLLDGQRRLVPKACALRHGPENFFPLLASFVFFGSSRFATPHRPGGTGVIEGAVITGLGAGVVE